jgi:hypothetical protein
MLTINFTSQSSARSTPERDAVPLPAGLTRKINRVKADGRNVDEFLRNSTSCSFTVRVRACIAGKNGNSALRKSNTRPVDVRRSIMKESALEFWRWFTIATHTPPCLGDLPEGITNKIPIRHTRNVISVPCHLTVHRAIANGLVPYVSGTAINAKSWPHP